MSPSDAWACTPQEFAACFHWKTQTMRKAGTAAAPTDDEARKMKAVLERELAKEMAGKRT
jgi:hypothetical protein